MRRRLFAAAESPVVTIRNAAATAKITVTKLRGNVSVLEGSGGNIAVLTGGDGKLLVDAGIPGTRARITEALASLSNDPVKHLINSHWHFDHTDGNEWLHSIGAEITAHENTRKHLSRTTRVEDWNFTFPPAPAGALPTKVLTADETLHLNGVALALKIYPLAHTDSDISVEFTDADILHAADTFWNACLLFWLTKYSARFLELERVTGVSLGCSPAPAYERLGDNCRQTQQSGMEFGLGISFGRARPHDLDC